MLTFDEINTAIAEQGARWSARETPIFRAGAAAGDPGSMSFGLRIDDDAGRLQPANVSIFDDLARPAPPASADWRASGHAGAVRDQGRCRACVAFATCAAIEASRSIAGSTVQLSPAHLFFCNGGACDAGWGLAHGLDAAVNGVGAEAELSWATDAKCVAVPIAAKVRSYRAHAEMTDRKRAVAAGPVIAGMAVHEDFLAYGDGIYARVAGDLVDYHAVCVVGYDDADGAWLAKNSWGPNFGDGGFFRIAYGECEIDTVHPFYSVVTE